jgi:transcriptional regulator with XRE-family HTH domain
MSRKYPAAGPAFPERLAQVRKERSMTQQALSDRVSIHVVQLRRYESGASQPTLDVIRNLAVALSVSADLWICCFSEKTNADRMKTSAFSSKPSPGSMRRRKKPSGLCSTGSFFAMKHGDYRTRRLKLKELKKGIASVIFSPCNTIERGAVSSVPCRLSLANIEIEALCRRLSAIQDLRVGRPWNSDANNDFARTSRWWLS